MNNNLLENVDDTSFLSLIFKLNHNFYSINSKYINGITTIPKNLEVVAGAPEYIRGIFEMRGEILPLVELRSVFDMPSLEDEYNNFKDMIEQRIQDHINWAERLEYCVMTGEHFELSINPHKCAFGQWYDSFETDIQTISHLMKKIDEPHKNLHKSAEEVFKCSQDCENCKREECLKNIFKKVKEEYVPTIVSLLNEAKQEFHHSFKEMVLLIELNNKKIGLITDEVMSVETLINANEPIPEKRMYNTKYIEGVSRSSNMDKTILRISCEKLFNSVKIDYI